MKKFGFLFTFLSVCLISTSFADDMTIPGIIEFDGVGVGVAQQFEHEDADAWKGWAAVSVKNTGTEAWGDFHFQIFQVTAETVENVHFTIDTPYEPTSSQTLDAIDGILVDNVVVGATLDLYFYGDPILPGETATFTAYTDNTTDNVSFFGMAMYPTPVPEPATMALFGFGALALFKRKK